MRANRLLFFCLLSSTIMCGGAEEESNTLGDPASTVELSDSLLFRSSTEWVASTDPISLETSMVSRSYYELRRFFPNGYAYVGRETDGIDDITCAARTNDRSGKPACVPYELESGAIVIDGRRSTLSRSGARVDIDGTRWEIIPVATALPQGRFELAGYFGEQTNVAASVEGATLEIDGASFAGTLGSRSYRFFDYSWWPSSCSRGCSLRGSISLRRYTVRVTPSGGSAKSFFFVDRGHEVQIGKQWFSR